MGRVRAVLFDLDGTLIDHEGAASVAIASWVRERGIGHRHPTEDVASNWLRLEAEHMNAYLHGAVTFAGQRRLRMKAFLAFLEQPDTTDLDAAFASYLLRYERAWTAYDDVTPTLAALGERGTAVRVLTNGDQAQQSAKLEAVGLGDAFACVLASSAILAAKPAVAAFAQACDRLGLAPDNVLYVGDDLHTDALAASRAGLGGVWLNRSGACAPARPWHTVHSLPAVVVIERTIE